MGRASHQGLPWSSPWPQLLRPWSLFASVANAMAPQRSRVFRGRSAELAQLGRLLDKARAGESAVLVVCGEAGIGKTALLDHCAGQASDFQVIRIAGVESEMELPFAGLHQLCAPMLSAVELLPDPQQNALRVAFGLMSGDPPDRFLVGLATLSLLAEVALKRPLLCVVDDAQWLDAASGQVLGFVGRRLLAESVLMLFSIREPTEDRNLARLPSLMLSGLSDADAVALLAAANPGRVDVHVRDRVVAETRGNPLALLELPRGMTAAELAGGFAVPRSGDLPSQLEEHFLRRFESLPEATQRLMLLAAAEPTGDVVLFWRAAQALGLRGEAAEPPGAEQLVEFGAQVRFRHPLVRSAVYSRASGQDRRAMHLALAAAMDPHNDPDRRAWHRALAAEGPDEEVASELERSAGRAQSRGGLAAAAAFLQRAVALTPEPAQRSERALAAAQASLQAGAFEAALGLLRTAEAGALDEIQGALADLLRGQIALASAVSGEAPALLLKAARRLEPLDLALAREAYLQSWRSAMMTGNFATVGTLGDISRAALTAPRPEGDPRLCDLALDAVALLVVEGRSEAGPTLRGALAAVLNAAAPADEELRWGWLLPTLPCALWDFEAWEAVNRRATQFARDAGALAVLPFTLVSEGIQQVFAGELRTAALTIAEGEAIAEVIGTQLGPYAGLLLAVFEGRGPETLTLIAATASAGRAGRQGALLQVAQWVEALYHNGLGRYQDAVRPARDASETVPELHISTWALPELVEAAARSGDSQLAIDAVQQFGQVAATSGTDWALGVDARLRALVSTGQLAEDCYRSAIEHLSRTRLRPDLARSYLLYGEWLRRQNRRVDAREQLHEAHDLFSEIGMLTFAERARHELQATGETVRKRRDETRNDLTPQEEQIARLALEGRTNPEIGAQLYISARTVEWHLRKVFTKLDITSRRGLRDALPARPATGIGN